jgi:hypothetical protein
MGSLGDSIDGAAAYLVRACDSFGRFTYRENLDGVPLEPRYNVLRHAGAIYALANYYDYSGDDAAGDAVLRGARYLLENHVKPLETKREVLAVWSLPEEETRNGRPRAKLGGTALGLIALLEARRIDGEAVSLETLTALGGFLTFLQRPSGGFFSGYDEHFGMDRSFVSLFYPGEAILALTLLYEYTQNRRWLSAASRGASFLIQERLHVPRERLPADHWLMIASARLQGHLSSLSDSALTRERLLDHNRDLAGQMLTEQSRVTESWAEGSFVADGRTSPTATRLEGLLALYGWLPPEDPLRPEIRVAAAKGVGFLRRSQVSSGPSKGGITRALRKLNGEGGSFNRRQREIRIDYVQHALSAWLQYRAQELDGSLGRSSSPSEELLRRTITSTASLSPSGTRIRDGHDGAAIPYTLVSKMKGARASSSSASSRGTTATTRCCCAERRRPTRIRPSRASEGAVHSPRARARERQARALVRILHRRGASRATERLSGGKDFACRRMTRPPPSRGLPCWCQ